MATSGGPNISSDGLVFGYDTGYPAADNTQALRFNNGEPTTNLVTNPDFSTGDMTGWSSTDTSVSQVDIREVSIENGYYYFHKKCTSTGAGSHDRLYQSSTYTLDTSLQTTVTIDIWINPQNAYSTSFYGLGSTADDTTYNEKPLSSNSSDVTTIDLGGGWTRYIYTLQTAWYTGSGTSFRVAVYPGWSGTGLLEYKVKSLQVEQKGHATPFVNGTRSSTQSLIDLKETTDIDVDDISFDSTGQPTFDGTDDYIEITDPNVSSGTGFSIEMIIKPNNASSSPMIITPNSAGIDHFVRFNSNGRLYMRMVVAADSTVQDFTTTTSLSSTEYHYVVFTFKQSEGGKAYYNSSLESSASANFTAQNWSSVWKIGQRGNSTYFFNGELPILKVHNKVLSSEEVKQNYNAYKKRFGL
jgi:hypothetical protein